MTDVKHAQLPWGIYGSTDSKQIYLKELGNTGPGIIAKVTNFADADLIQRAVNAHYDLVEALEAVDKFFTAQGKHIDDYCGSVHTHPVVKAALAKARGEA